MEPTAVQSLEVLNAIIEEVPMKGKERDVVRQHVQNILKAIQPPEGGVLTGAPKGEVPVETKA